MRSRQRLQSALFIAIPLILAAGYTTARYIMRRDLQQRVARSIADGQSELGSARRLNAQTNEQRKQAYTEFDAGNTEQGETLWTQARSSAVETDRAFGRASQLFEAALAADHNNERARELLADSLFERALGAERERNTQQLEDLLQRLSVYDLDGTRRTRWQAPGRIKLQVLPENAHVLLGHYEPDARLKRRLNGLRELDALSRTGLSLQPGSYVFVLSAPEHSEVSMPFLVARGEEIQLNLELPKQGQVPRGFVYIPAGSSLFGSADESMRKSFLSTVPVHRVSTDAFLIARNETTYGEWIEYLNTLPLPQRQTLLNRPEKGNLSGSLRLSQLADGSYQLKLQPLTVEATARSTEPLVFSARKDRAKQDWLRLPVGGVTYDDAAAYAAWLSQSGRVQGARLCTEFEWERAARGADDREFPHGDSLDGNEANHDATYNRDNAALGPDEVGSYPISRSPFGVDDMAGNVFEWVQSSLKKDDIVARSGAFSASELTLRSTNRNVFDRVFRDPGIGFRICASWPSKR
jgi:formylglycine-generating enzyme required for sulfatase activity